MTTYSTRAVGHVTGGRDVVEDDHWGACVASIELDPALFTADALLGLDAFSHVEIVFVFDRVSDDQITYESRHPRGNTDWPKVGIFAQRGKNRPSRIGVTVCQVIRVEGLTVEVEGLDAINGTPVLDIKPVMSGFLPRGKISEPDWARAIMANYW